MLQTVLLLSICGLVKSSGLGVAQLTPIAPIGAAEPLAPVVTSASSQYFERTFNRLLLPPVITPVAPPPVAPVPIAPAPTVFVEPTKTIPVAVNPVPPQEVQPNVAIAIATAQAAAPVATILLPPYPFGFPPNFGFLPSDQPINVPDENTKELTTQKTKEPDASTTTEPDVSTPIDASSSDNSIVQALPSNENVHLKQYGPHLQAPRPLLPEVPQSQRPDLQLGPQQANSLFQPNLPNSQFKPQQTNTQQLPQQTQSQQYPQYPPYPPLQEARPQPQLPIRPQPQPRPNYQPRPQQSWPKQKGRPQKFKTSVEVVPVPLAYITPPPLHKTHDRVKIVKHIYAYVPASSTKIILKPVKIRPVRLVKHKIVEVHTQNLRTNARDIEVTTFNPFLRANSKPPRA